MTPLIVSGLSVDGVALDGRDVLQGGSGSDYLFGGSEADNLSGDADDDYLDAAPIMTFWSMVVPGTM